MGVQIKTRTIKYIGSKEELFLKLFRSYLYVVHDFKYYSKFIDYNNISYVKYFKKKGNLFIRFKYVDDEIVESCEEFIRVSEQYFTEGEINMLLIPHIYRDDKWKIKYVLAEYQKRFEI